jgi:hypothetical protein
MRRIVATRWLDEHDPEWRQREARNPRKPKLDL